MNKSFFYQVFSSTIGIIALLAFSVVFADDKKANEYIVTYPSLSLYPEIPPNAIKFLNKEISIYEGSGTKPLSILKQGEIVIEKEKNKGAYLDSFCMKDKNTVQYDWSVMRDWMCVEINGQMGWLHKWGVLQIPESIPQLTFYTQHFPPFASCFSKPEGVGVEILQLICMNAELDCLVQCKTKETWWETVHKKVEDGKGDGLFFTGWTDKKEEYLYFPASKEKNNWNKVIGKILNKVKYVKEYEDLTKYYPFGLSKQSTEQWTVENRRVAFLLFNLGIRNKQNEIRKLLEKAGFEPDL